MHQIDLEDLTGGPERGKGPASAPGKKGMTNRERAARHRDKMKGAGLVQVNLWLPPEIAADFQQAAGRIRQDPDLTMGPLRRISTGKLERL